MRGSLLLLALGLVAAFLSSDQPGRVLTTPEAHALAGGELTMPGKCCEPVANCSLTQQFCGDALDDPLACSLMEQYIPKNQTANKDDCTREDTPGDLCVVDNDKHVCMVTFSCEFDVLNNICVTLHHTRSELNVPNDCNGPCDDQPDEPAQ